MIETEKLFYLVTIRTTRKKRPSNMASPTSIPTTMLLTTILILSSRPARGSPHVDFPSACDDSTLILDNGVGSTLRKNFIVNPELKCLAIPYSGVKSIENGAFDGVPNLIHLNLTGNSIPPDQLFSFGKSTNLESLAINDQQSNAQINKVLVRTVYPSLKSLSLRNTKLNTMTVSVQFPFPVLEHLDLSQNHYTVYRPMEKMFHDTVVRLDLSQNQITLVNVHGFGKLVKLELYSNQIQSIGNGNDLNLQGLRSLEELFLWKNRIASINKSAFKDTRNLRHLNLWDNSLTTLDAETFSPLSSLEILDLDQNKLVNVPAGLPASLTSLSMECNDVSHLTMAGLDGLTKLRRLSLEGNRISRIDRTAFLSQGELRELYLGDNRLTELPAYWDVNMKSLIYLDLAGNRFTAIQSALKLVLSPLVLVHMDENPIVMVDHNALKGVPKNTSIYLNVGVERRKKCPLLI